MATVNRRNFLTASLTTPVSASLLLGAAGQTSTADKTDRIVDAHVYLSRWPGRRIIGDQTPELAGSLKEFGVAEAWAGSFDALLHKDMGGVNSRLAEECAKHGQGLLSPVGAVNPTLPDWEEDVRRCHEEYRMPGIRVHPNYHNYTLSDPAFVRLLRVASERGLVVQIVVWMEDERTQTPLLLVPMVDLRALPAALEQAPGARVMILNGFVSVRSAAQVLPGLKKFNNVVFDFAMLEQLMGLKVLADAIGLDRIVFGSYSPMFYFESALLKIREAAFTPAQSKAVTHENIRRLLNKA